MAVGIVVIFGEFVNSEIRGGTFHFEYLLLGAAFCGLSITQWGDRQ